MTIPMKPVKSSNIQAVGHDAASNTLAVQFANGTYHYPGVSKAEADKFTAASSLGAHFAQHIRPKFKGALQNAPKK